MIEYLYTEGKETERLSCKVRLDGRIVGNIMPVVGGWRYFPKGDKNGGDLFNTLQQCQETLEDWPGGEL